MNKETKEMTRPEIINALAKYAHPSHYKDMIKWRTEELNILLAYYQGRSEINITFNLPK